MSALAFAHLTDVPLRQAWPHEALDLTPWLADNLDRLGEVIGLPSLDLVGTEVGVEGFAADILARDAAGDRLVLIENQLEQSDHTHLGQIMTYLSGLEASVMVWIAPRLRDAHLSALRWLNENTADPFAFFAVRLRVVRIGESALAPLLEPMEQPDGWHRQLRAQMRERGELSADAQLRQAFWAMLDERHPDLAEARPYAGSSRWLATVDDRVWLSLFLSKSGPGLFVRGPREDAGAPHALLGPFADALTIKLGTPFDADGRYVLSERRLEEMADPARWPDAADWLADRARAYRTALSDVLSDETER